MPPRWAALLFISHVCSGSTRVDVMDAERPEPLRSRVQNETRIVTRKFASGGMIVAELVPRSLAGTRISGSATGSPKISVVADQSVSRLRPAAVIDALENGERSVHDVGIVYVRETSRSLAKPASINPSGHVSPIVRYPCTIGLSARLQTSERQKR